MGESNTTHDKLAANRVTPYCGQCGYRLEGLPEEGLCPECGSAYQPDDIVIAGWGSGAKETAWNAPPERAIKVLLLGVSGLVLLAIPKFLRGRIWEGVFYLIWPGLMVAVGIYKRWRLTSDYSS